MLVSVRVVIIYVNMNNILRIEVILVICRYLFLVIENFLLVLILIIFWNIVVLFLLLLNYRGCLFFVGWLVKDNEYLFFDEC